MRLKLFSLMVLVLLFVDLFPKVLIAADLSQTMSLSDAISADLAMNQELDHISVYYFDGNANNTVSINAQKIWYAASTVKLFAAMYAYSQIATGKITLDEPITINGANVSPSDSDTNSYPTLQEGDTVSVYRLIDQMITQSDNTAFNTLLDLLDRREVSKYIQSLGLTNSIVGGKLNLDDANQQTETLAPGFDDNATTAQDYAKAFILIDEGKIPGSKDLFNMLSRQKLNTMLPALLPSDVIIAHKTGELDPFYHDGGIIIGPGKRYILTIFSDAGDPSILAHISNLIYTKNITLLPPKVDQEVVPVQTIPQVSIDLSGSLNLKELPKVLVPKDSPLHFLVDLGFKAIINLNPIPSLRIHFEIENLKLQLAEANDLILRGKKNEGNATLQEISTLLSNLTSQKRVSQNPTLLSLIEQISKTRFLIAKNALPTISQ